MRRQRLLHSLSFRLPCLRRHPPEEREGGGAGVLQGGQAGIGDSAWLLPPLVSSGGPSVPQDDFDKARHVSFFGVVGGEERMLLQWRRAS